MASSMKSFSEIENFKNGIFDQQQQKEFEKKLLTDQALREAYELSLTIDKAISDQQAFAFESALKKAEVSFKKKRNYEVIYRIAASLLVLVLIGGGYLLLNNKPGAAEKIYGKYYESYQALSGTRSSGVAHSQDVVNAFNAYSKGDYLKASAEFSGILANQQGNNQVRFFLGLSLLEINNTTLAEKHFLDLITQKDVFYGRLAEYYLGMTYLKSGKKEMAIRQFSLIAAQKGNYQVKAQAILDELRQIK